MTYIDTSRWFDSQLVPLVGENFAAFRARLLPAMQGLDPDTDPACHEQTIKTAWANFLFRNATEITLTMKREVDTWTGLWYMESYFTDWMVTDVHEARLISFAAGDMSTEMATADSGEVFKIAKSKEDEQLVFGWANIAIGADGNYPIDWDGDITDPSDLEKAAYNFVLKYRATGEQHQGEVKGQLVESIMFTKEKQAALGIPDGVLPEGWWVGFHVPDKEVFAKIKSGEYQMFSVEGTAIRDPLQAEGGE